MRRYPLKWLSSDRREWLSEAVKAALPALYSFEIEKTLQRISEAGAKRVCLQLPEGLMIWAATISRIIEDFGNGIESCVIIGDVTYGACCIDDLKARDDLDCDFLVHYAHSCLIPLNEMVVKCLYVFVEIDLDANLLVENLVKALPPAICESQDPERPQSYMKRRIVLMSTIQFSKCAHTCARILREKFWPNDDIIIPQEAPLSQGETLGCTSVRLDDDVDMCIFISDGRFHIESAMIQNPHVKFYRYDPFLSQLFAEYYDLPLMLKNRSAAIERAMRATRYIIIMSVLGRQGCPDLVYHLKNLIETERGGASEVEVSILLLAELIPKTLETLANGDDDICFVNVGCPRLSIDWGTEYTFNVINSFEMVQALRKTSLPLTSYTMDYFSANGGEWSNAPYRSAAKKQVDFKAEWQAKKLALLSKIAT